MGIDQGIQWKSMEYIYKYNVIEDIYGPASGMYVYIYMYVKVNRFFYDSAANSHRLCGGANNQPIWNSASPKPSTAPTPPVFMLPQDAVGTVGSRKDVAEKWQLVVAEPDHQATGIRIKNIPIYRSRLALAQLFEGGDRSMDHGLTQRWLFFRHPSVRKRLVAWSNPARTCENRSWPHSMETSMGRCCAALP